MTTNKIVDTVLQTMKPTFETTQTIIDMMKDGDRKQVKEIISLVSTSMGVPDKQVSALVNYYLHNLDTEEAGYIGYVTQGMNGGFIKGKRKTPKVDKTVKKVIDVKALNSIIEEFAEETDVDDEIAIGQ
jgi:hypothetical protein